MPATRQPAPSSAWVQAGRGRHREGWRPATTRRRCGAGGFKVEQADDPQLPAVVGRGGGGPGGAWYVCCPGPATHQSVPTHRKTQSPAAQGRPRHGRCDKSENTVARSGRPCW